VSAADGSETVLTRILAHKRKEVAQRSAATPQSLLESRAVRQPAARGFVRALQARIDDGEPAVIAEIKKASPSKGLIRADFDPVAIARSYARAGAACLSVLTDEHFFLGHDDYLAAARDVVTLPVLRKDFTVDAYQLYEARALGADCVLLIVTALGAGQLKEFHGLARELGLDVLVEVHDASELESALALDPALIGINNRNLHTFETRLDTTYALLERIPENTIVVTESGIRDPAQVSEMRARGVNAFLVGEAFMREPDPGAALKALFDLNVQ
jgi:indole-3-glycerol phosphate synthase